MYRFYQVINKAKSKLGGYFNTSYVSVLPSGSTLVTNLAPYFNTSYVSVLLGSDSCFPILINDFNTSYVSVLRAVPYSPPSPCNISIHPMYRFYEDNVYDGKTLLNFNTSYVSVLLICCRNKNG